MPRLPQFAAFLLAPGRPAEIVAAIVAGDRLDQLDLLGHAGLGAVELEEQRRRDLGWSSFEYLLIASICGSSSQLDPRATGMPLWIVRITACRLFRFNAAIVGKAQTAAEIESGMP